MAMIGRPVVRATILAVPVVEPPPIETRPSTLCSAATRRASSATASGTCGRTPLKRTATRSRHGALSSSASAPSASAAMSMTRVSPSASSSPATAVRLDPAPNVTR